MKAQTLSFCKWGNWGSELSILIKAKQLVNSKNRIKKHIPLLVTTLGDSFFFLSLCFSEYQISESGWGWFGCKQGSNASLKSHFGRLEANINNSILSKSTWCIFYRGLSRTWERTPPQWFCWYLMLAVLIHKDNCTKLALIVLPFPWDYVLEMMRSAWIFSVAVRPFLGWNEFW